MSVTMDDGIKRWTAKRKTALVVWAALIGRVVMVP